MTILLALILAPAALLTFFLVAELFVGLRPLRVPTFPASSPSAIIIVPAHDEEAALFDRLAALVEAASGHAGILLVADNCSDSTAAIGRKLGVAVIERVDAVRRGKGFALDFAKQHLSADPPEVIVIIDADCTIDRESLRQLISCSAGLGRPCQSTNLQAPQWGSSPAVKLSTFAFYVKNVVRQRALQRLAGRVHLLGTGMALPWTVFEAADLATGSIVEDLKLGLDLAVAGHPALFLESATIWSNAETERNTLAQRRRWEGGFLQNALHAGPAMVGNAIKIADPRALWGALDLLIPPLALLALLDLASLCLGSAAACFAGASWWPVLLLGAMVLLAGLGLGLAWSAGGRHFVSLGDLARAPFYVAWKLPLYFGLLRRGAPKTWQRTDRRAG